MSSSARDIVVHADPHVLAAAAASTRDLSRDATSNAITSAPGHTLIHAATVSSTVPARPSSPAATRA